MQLNILHWIIQIIFWALIAALFVRAILSWLTMIFLRPDAPIIRFFDQLTAPMIEPVRRRIPTMSLGMFDLGYLIAFLVVWWALDLLLVLILTALPAGW